MSLMPNELGATPSATPSVASGSRALDAPAALSPLSGSPGRSPAGTDRVPDTDESEEDSGDKERKRARVGDGSRAYRRKRIECTEIDKKMKVVLNKFCEDNDIADVERDALYAKLNEAVGVPVFATVANAQGAFDRESTNTLERWTPKKPCLLEHGLAAFALGLKDPKTDLYPVVEWRGQHKFCNTRGAEWALTRAGVYEDPVLLRSGELPADVVESLKDPVRRAEILSGPPGNDKTRTAMLTEMSAATKYIVFQAEKEALAAGEDPLKLEIKRHVDKQVIGGDPTTKGQGIVCNAVGKPYVISVLKSVHTLAKSLRVHTDRTTARRAVVDA